MDIIGIVGVATGAVAIPIAAVATATSVVGISQGVSGQQGGGEGGGGGGGGKEEKDDPRLAKFNLYAECAEQSTNEGAAAAKEVDGKIVVLRKGKLFLDSANPKKRKFPDGHPFSGFFLEYPVGTPKPLALVSTISRDPPELNWIYADDDTLELKYGNKTASIDHIHGPWDWTDDESRLMLEEWEGFVAMEEEEGSGVWGVYYDVEDDLLEGSGIREGRRVVEVCLRRRLGQSEK